MPVFGPNEYLRPLIELGLWVFRHNQNEAVSLEEDESEGQPFSGLKLSGVDLAPIEYFPEAELPQWSTDHHGGAAADTHQSDGRENTTAVVTCASVTDVSCSTSLLVDDHIQRLDLSLLLLILSYHRKDHPLPLAVAAASPRLRLAGELHGAYAFPLCIIQTAPLAEDVMQARFDERVPASDSSLPLVSLRTPSFCRCSATSQWINYGRVIRGVSLAGVLPLMEHSLWWFRRPVMRVYCYLPFHCSEEGGWTGDMLRYSSGALPISIAVQAPRSRPVQRTPSGQLSSSLIAWISGMFQWWRGGLPRSVKGSAPSVPHRLRQLMSQPQRWHGAEVVELLLANLPLEELAELFFPTTAGDSSATTVPIQGSQSQRRVGVFPVFPDLVKLKYQNQTQALPTSVMVSIADAAPRLHTLDLSHTRISSLEHFAQFRSLQRILLVSCHDLNSLSPLGDCPSLCEVVASQSGVFDMEGLSRSQSLRSLSLYGCLYLTEVTAAGRIPTLQEVFLSASTVESLDGLAESRSIIRIGIRYCDVTQLSPISTIATLTVLHASSSTIASVDSLRTCQALEEINISSCMHVTDLSALGYIKTLRVIDASGSAVQRIDGLADSSSLISLSLNHCTALLSIGRLGRCPSLQVLCISTTPVTDIDGLSGAASLRDVDVSFCKQLSRLHVVGTMQQLINLDVRGCSSVFLTAEDQLRFQQWLAIANPHLTISL